MKLSGYILVFAAALAIVVVAQTSAQGVATETMGDIEFEVRRGGALEVISLPRGETLNFKELLSDTDATIRRMLELTAPGEPMMEYVVTSVTPLSEKRNKRISFVQVVNGHRMPAKSSIGLRANGDVVIARIIRCNNVLEPAIDKAYALELAAKAIADELSVASVIITDVEEAVLKYRLDDNSAVPYWEIRVLAQERRVDFDFDKAEVEMIGCGEPDEKLIEKIQNYVEREGRVGYRKVRINAFNGESTLPKTIIFE